MQTAIEPVVIKGTRYGLLASIREDADHGEALRFLQEKLKEQADFLSGSSLSIDYGWREIASTDFDALEGILKERGIALNGILSTSLNTRTIAEGKGYKAIIGRLGLAKHQGRALRRRQQEEPPSSEVETKESAPASVATENAPQPAVGPLSPEPIEAGTPASAEVLEIESSASPPPDDEEPTLYLRKTLRSGQKVVFAGNVVITADVNPGAEIEAEGDIIILGTLRGTAHAGCAGNKEATVSALSMNPTQLRIADIFLDPLPSRRRAKKADPMQALLKGDEVQLEPFSIR